MRRTAIKIWLPVLAIVIVAGALRATGIAGRGLWIDEAFTVRLAQLDLGQLCARTALDNHPPLYFILLKLWAGAFGSSVLALRALDLLLGVATVGLVYALARRILRATPAAGLGAAIAAGWVALLPVHVMWSAQVRMYALAGCLAVGAALLLLHALDRPTSWSRWAAWTIAAVALVYTHYYGAFVVLAQGVHACVVVSRSPERRAALVRVVASGVAACAAFAPWIGVVASQSARVSAAWWVPALSPSRVLWSWSRTAGLLVEDEYAVPSGLRAVAIGTLAIALATVICVGALQRERDTRLVAWCTAVPVVGGIVASLLVGQNVVLARYLIVGDGFLPIAVVAMVFSHANRRAGALMMAPIAVFVALALVDQVVVLAPQPDVTAAAAWIAQRRQPGDLLVVTQFNYWSFRIAGRDPQLRLYSPRGKPIPVLGGALVTEDDTVLGPASLPGLHGRMFVVDSKFAHVVIPPTYRKLDSDQFAVSMPPSPQFAIRTTLYDAP